MHNLILVMVLPILFFIGCTKDTSNIVKIALVCPLTGDVAAMGQGMKRAAELAVEEANESGKSGIYKLVLAAYDDRADPKEAVNVANQIISDTRVYAIVGHLNSGCSIPASQVYAKRNLLMLSPASTNPKLTLQGLKNVFRICTTDDVQGSYAADYVYDNLQLRKVSVIQDKTAYGQGIAEEFRNRFTQRGGKVLSFDGVDLGNKDFKALLTRIKSLTPELIYFGGMYTECGHITKQKNELGLKVPVFSADGVHSPEYIKIGGKATEGDYVSMIGLPAEKLPSAQSFRDKYATKYHGVDIQPYDVYTYETVNLVIATLLKSNFDQSKMVSVASGLDYTGVLGNTKFDEKGDTLNKTISLYQVQSGKFIYKY